MFDFEVTSTPLTGSYARTGRFTTPHGEIATPVFMPVGTKGTVKSFTPDDLLNLGTEIILGNTYHLFLRPGDQFLAERGGLHKWIHWNKPILTDSGGFQVFSLKQIRKIDEDGVEFQSIHDGSKHYFSPERVMEIEANIGADIIMAFDECAPGKADYNYARAAMERTHRWLERCVKSQKRVGEQALFPIVQGVTYDDLRRESCEFVSQFDLPGIAVGGLAVGEPKETTFRVLDTLAPYLPAQKPHYLMGVGSPEDLWECIHRGIDMFDCVLPTRVGRHGGVFTPLGRVDLKRTVYRTSEKPIDETCNCYTCKNFTVSYLRHLIVENEMLGAHLCSLHNIHFLFEQIRVIRAAIKEGTFLQKKAEFTAQYRYMGSGN